MGGEESLKRRRWRGCWVCLAMTWALIAGAEPGEALEAEVRALVAQSIELQMRHPEKAVELGEQAVSLLGPAVSLEEQFEAWTALAQALLRADASIRLIEVARAARHVAVQLGDPVRETRAQRMLLGALIPMGDFAQAIEINFSILQQAEALGDEEGRYAALISIGALYWQMRDWASAEGFIRQAREAKLKTGELGFADYNNYGVALMELGRLEEAREQFEAAEPHAAESTQPYQMALLLSNLGDLYQRMGDTLTARAYLDEGLAKLESIGSDWVKLRSLRHYAHVLALEGDHAGAVAKAEEALAMARGIGNPSEQMDCLDALLAIHEAAGSWREALAVSQELATLNEQILGQRVRNQAIIRAIDLDFAAQQELIGQLRLQKQVAELESANLRQADRARLIQRNALLAGLVLVLLAFLVTLAQFRIIVRSRRQLQTQQDELARTNDDLRRLMEEKDEFVGIVAHDLRNPLSAIQSAAAELQEQASPGGGSAAAAVSGELLRCIEQSSEAMEKIIADLLDLERINQQGFAARLEPLDAVDLVSSLVERKRQAAAAKRQDLELRVESSAEVLADGGMLQQVVENLLSNAVKYTPIGGQIRVTLRLDPSACLCLRVEDSGPGIPPARRDQLFTKFSRIGSRTTADEPSTGLGLYIAARLAGLMNARLAYAEAELGGAAFSLLVPLAKAK